ncbi:MAG TPA: lytic murein transglycosylase [Bdellovibrionota bacterium]|nr:lytic murein transglycosylase [Bdellovibrionota bacterium]
MDRTLCFSKFWFIFAALLPASIANGKSIVPTSVEPIDYAVMRLRSAGISDDLISIVKQSHVPEERDRIVEMNVLGFLGKADYSAHLSHDAIRRCREFIAAHHRQLVRVEKRSGVPKEVIAALLWVETKHGRQTGNHKVGHVYFSLLQADHPEVLKSTMIKLLDRAPAQADDSRQKVIDRSIAKSNWALIELRSLDAIQKSGRGSARDLVGSYAGAFGIPQFIPSSYLQWARPGLKARHADLFKMDDAIQSVAFYLKSNGWKRKDQASHRSALLHYNRAQGYVDVILKIAQCVKAQGERCSLSG